MIGVRLRRGLSCTLKVRPLRAHAMPSAALHMPACNACMQVSSSLPLLQAILVCHVHRVAPTLVTIFELAALAGHLLPSSSSSSGGGDGSSHTRRPRPFWVVAAAQGALHMAHGFAPAVVVAQAVRLAANLVREAEQRRLGAPIDDKDTTEGEAWREGYAKRLSAHWCLAHTLESHVHVKEER